MTVGRQNVITRLAAMPLGPRKIAAGLAVAALAAASAGCGSGDDKSIPSSESEQLIAQLNEVEAQVSAGRCELAQGGAQQFHESVDQLPSEVDSETKSDLTKLADNLVELANDPGQCGTEEGATSADGAFTESTTTETSVPETTETTTDETTTKPEEPQPAEPQPSDQGSQGDGSEGSGEVGGDLGGSGSTSGSTGGVKPKGQGR
jgi:hypothetical protein